MKVNKRLIDIFGVLIDKKETSIKELCKSLDLSERSVRYEIENINYILSINGLDEIRKLEKGRLLLDKNEKSIKDFKSFINVARFSKEDRFEYIYSNILLNGKINITKATRELEVSRTTVKNDLKEIEDELLKNSIVIKENEIISSEYELRSFILKKYCMKISQLYYDIILDENNKCNFEYYICRLLTKDKINSIKKYVNSLSKEFNNATQQFYEVIFSYLIISYIRIKNGNIILKLSNKEFLNSTREYKYLAETIEELENSLGIDIKNEELSCLADHLLGLTSYAYNTTIFENWVETKMVVKDIIDYVGDKSDINIKNDDVLLSGLLNHLKPMIYRAKNGMSIDKELYYQSLEGNYTLYKIVKESLKPLERLIKIKFNNEEVALFTIHFLASIRRNEDKLPMNKRILLVCGGGYGTAGIIKNILEENYNVEIIDTTSIYQVLQYDMKNIDLIVCTININKEIEDKLQKPIVLVTPFFTFKDEEILNEFNITRKRNEKLSLEKLIEIIGENATIHNIDKLKRDIQSAVNKNHKDIIQTPKTLFELLDESKVEIVDNIDSWREALEKCGEKLIRTDEIKAEYMQEIFNIIETFGAYFVLANEIAIPHGQFNVNVNSPCMSIMYIREGVVFPGDMLVKLIVLIASSEKNILIKTVEKISKLSQKKNLYKDLENISNRTELINYLKR